MLIPTIFLIFFVSSFSCLEPSNIQIVIISQNEGYHVAHAKLLKDRIIEEAGAVDKNPPKILLTHEEHINGSWTFFPLIPLLSSTSSKIKWFIFCLDNTAIRFQALLKLLSTFDSEKNYFIGHALYDKEPTIIHHFADHTKKFKYPNVASAFGISISLLKSLNKRIKNSGLPDIDFNIDASYEFASWIYNDGKGSKLTHVPEFCIFATEHCVSHPKGFHSCAGLAPQEKIFVAIKTYEKNHDDRIPMIKKTWLKFVKNYNFFSNIQDLRLSNIIVVPNTTQGHCAKTHAILQHADRILKDKNMDWLVVVDDDTIMSMKRLTRLLTCYNPKHPIAIGERYGYRVIQGLGYEYLTGGAGLALSAPLIERIVDSPGCKCPEASTPDDMFLFGICLSRVGVQVTHSPLFHQARPSDYALAYLASQEPISFHKFWMIDPIQVYQHWFAEADSTLDSDHQHTEL